jgi:hypothetical protein
VKSVSVNLSIFATFATFDSVSHCDLVFRPRPYPLLRFTSVNLVIHLKPPQIQLRQYSIVTSTTFVSYLDSKRLVKVSVCCDYPNRTHCTSAVVLHCSHIPIALSPSYIYIVIVHCTPLRLLQAHQWLAAIKEMGALS